MEDQLKFDKSTFVCYKTTKINEEYLLGETLGQGAFGTVRKAVHKLTNQERAIKILKKRQQDERKLFLEVNILSKLAHPNIMEIYEFYEDKANFYIVSEFCRGGELFDAMTEKGVFKEAEACPIMLQLVSAICYSHSNNIVHRDLKPENIMLDKVGNTPIIKLIDWGGARYFSKNKKMTTIKGTPYYIAPEVIKEVYDEKCDIWSLGVIFYVLLCGYPPFNGDTDVEIIQNVQKGKFIFPEEEWGIISSEAKDLIKKMLTYEPSKRISAKEVLLHPWFSHYEEQLVSKEDRADLLNQFLFMDKNKDGVLTKEEIIESYRNVYGTIDPDVVENMIKSIDLDGNGVIDYHEFLNCTMNRNKILSKKNLQYAFNAFDKDGNGSISIDEIMSIFKKTSNNVDKKVFEKMMKDADSNGDGAIEFEEFNAIMQKFFE